MSKHRKGERGSVPFRSGRFFNIDSEWYFTCRDGVDYGPFESKDAALAALEQHLGHNPVASDRSSNNITQPAH